MKTLSTIILLIALTTHAPANAQADTAAIPPSKHNTIKYILPASLISYGILAHTAAPFRQLDKFIDRQAAGLNAHSQVDDYIQYLPAIAVYGLDLCGIKAKNNLRDRTLILASSYIITTIAVNAIKYTAAVPRPTGQAHNSFPSGHTATAFTGAHILFHEYKDASPWTALSGYAAATAVATMRILNRRHWLGDTIAGAGIGILSVEASYLLLPSVYKTIGLPGNLAVLPSIGNGSCSIGMACSF